MNLSDYSDAYMHIQRTITVANTSAADANNTNEKLIFKDFAPFTDCIGKINSTQEYNAKNTDIVKSRHNLTEFNEIYSKTSESLWQHHRGKPTLGNDHNIINFSANKNNNSILFEFKENLTGKQETIFQKILI